MRRHHKLGLFIIGAPLFLPLLLTLTFYLMRSPAFGALLLDIQSEYPTHSDKVSEMAIQTLHLVDDPTFGAIFEAANNEEGLGEADLLAPPDPEFVFQAPLTTKPTKPQKRAQKATAILDRPVLDDDPFLSKPKKERTIVSIQNPPKHSAVYKVNTHINIDPEKGTYLNYTSVSGTVDPLQDDRPLIVEVSFLDQVGYNGLETDISTVLAAQEIRNAPFHFSLRLPAESQGYLIAKAYHVNDEKKEDPLYIGMPKSQPLRVSKEGVYGLKIPWVPMKDFLRERETVLAGRISNDYDIDGVCLANADVWIVETRQHVTTNNKCIFEVTGLLPDETYHVVYEKTGFMPREIVIRMERNKIFKHLSLSPESKFTRGYDVFLGKRWEGRATVFARVLKDGKPLERAIILNARAEKVVYEEDMGGISVPDVSLYSTAAAGKFILWNARAGESTFDVYHNGEWLGSHTMRLYPGVVHQLTIRF